MDDEHFIFPMTQEGKVLLSVLGSKLSKHGRWTADTQLTKKKML